MVICTHAASMIAIGRVLTGLVPDDPAVDDFKTYTAGISTFKRRSRHNQGQQLPQLEVGKAIPELDWKGQGVAGGWDLIVDSDTSHLSEGPQRGWYVSPSLLALA